MEITERDLFNFVFYKNLVDRDKAEFLEKTDTFKNEIDLFSSIKKSLSEELSPQFKKNILQKIPHSESE